MIRPRRRILSLAVRPPPGPLPEHVVAASGIPQDELADLPAAVRALRSRNVPQSDGLVDSFRVPRPLLPPGETVVRHVPEPS